MKKIIAFIVLMILMIFLIVDETKAFGPFKQGKYLENYQWGALEELINDWQNHKISTDECALIGCYVLCAKEPVRSDKDQKAKLIPAKYNLDKKSKEAGPYFFVYFLYKIQGDLNEKALNEYKNSDWCEDTFINEVVCNKEVDNAIKKIQSLPKKDLQIDEHDLYDVLLNLAEKNVISYDSIYIISMIQFNNNKQFHKIIKDFSVRNNLKKLSSHFALIAQLCHKCREIPHNRLAINIFNFHYKYWDLNKVNLYGLQ